VGVGANVGVGASVGVSYLIRVRLFAVK
jgi:hypothetical protein